MKSSAVRELVSSWGSDDFESELLDALNIEFYELKGLNEHCEGYPDNLQFVAVASSDLSGKTIRARVAIDFDDCCHQGCRDHVHTAHRNGFVSVEIRTTRPRALHVELDEIYDEPDGDIY